MFRLTPSWFSGHLLAHQRSLASLLLSAPKNRTAKTPSLDLDDDFADILGSDSDSDNRSPKKTKNLVAKSNASSFKNVDLSTEAPSTEQIAKKNIPQSKTAMPESAAPRGNKQLFKESLSPAQPVLANKYAKTTETRNGNDLDTILSSLQDMDDMDSQLFGKPTSSAGAIRGRRAGENATASSQLNPQNELNSTPGPIPPLFQTTPSPVGSIVSRNPSVSSHASATLKNNPTQLASHLAGSDDRSSTPIQPVFLSGSHTGDTNIPPDTTKQRVPHHLSDTAESGSLMNAAQERAQRRSQEQRHTPSKTKKADDDVADDDLFDLLGLGKNESKKRDTHTASPFISTSIPVQPKPALPISKDATDQKAKSSYSVGGTQPIKSIFTSFVQSRPSATTSESQSIGAQSIESAPGGRPRNDTSIPNIAIGQSFLSKKPISGLEITSSSISNHLGPPSNHVVADIGSSNLRTKKGSVPSDDGLPLFMLESATTDGKRRGGRSSIASTTQVKSSGSDPMDLIASLMSGTSVMGNIKKPAPATGLSIDMATPTVDLPFLTNLPKSAHKTIGSVPSSLAVELPRVEVTSSTHDKPYTQPAIVVPILHPSIESPPQNNTTSANLASVSLSSIALLSETDDDTSEPITHMDHKIVHNPITTSTISELQSKGQYLTPKSPFSSKHSRKRADLVSNGISNEEMELLEKKLAAAQEDMTKLTAELEDLREKEKIARMNSEARHSETVAENQKQHLSQIQSLKDDHYSVIERLKQNHDETMSKAVKFETDRIRADYERQIHNLCQEHLNKIQQLTANTESAQQLSQLAGKMEENSNLIGSLQDRLEEDHAVSLKHREDALIERERLACEQQDIIRNERHAIDVEKEKILEMVQRMESMLNETTRKQEQDMQVIYRDRTRLASQIDDVQKERNELQSRLQREQSEFSMNREAWELERKRLISSISEERKTLAKDQSKVASLDRMNQQMQEELSIARERFENESQAELAALQKETSILHERYAILHRDESHLRAERVRVEALKSRLDIEKSVAESEKGYMESSIHQAAVLHGEASRERLKLQEMQTNVELVQQQIQTEKQELELQRNQMQMERNVFVDNRVSLAEYRNKTIQSARGPSTVCQSIIEPKRVSAWQAPTLPYAQGPTLPSYAQEPTLPSYAQDPCFITTQRNGLCNTTTRSAVVAEMLESEADTCARAAAERALLQRLNACMVGRHRAAEALKKYSAFAVLDPRVSESENTAFLNLIEDYFAQDYDTKMKDARPDVHFQVGVTPENTEEPRCGRDDDCMERVAAMEPENRPLDFTQSDKKWRFFWRMGERPTETKFPQLNAAPVVPENMPDWSNQMNHWGSRMLNAVTVVSEMAATGLGLPRDTFSSRAKFGPHLLGPTASDLTKYGQVDNVFAGFHTDLNFMTIHGKSRFSGLHIWTPSGEKLLVKIPDGSLLVQAGKQMEWITGGHIKAGYHEVVVVPQTLEAIERQRAAGRPLWRISSTLFFHLGSDILLEPLEPFRDEVSIKKYPAILTGEQVQVELGFISLAKKD
ncbi:hypothetical protein BASA61_003460 [Batrachochytrium salamandrivorans]|nr:hypothetical protein BASA61_003460 [Batrachochytrium salamandrivorans]